MKLQLRDYQARGRDDIRAEFGRRRRRVLYVLPTGGGKTVLYAAIAEGAAEKSKRVLILEHRKELIRQASIALGRLGIRHQVVAPKKRMTGIRAAHVEAFGIPMLDARATVAVASVQTLAVRPDWLADFDPDLIVIDEAHHAVAGSWAKIIAACPRALLLGVTATPCRTNGQGLGDVFEVMVLGPSPADLTADGWLLPARIVAPPVLADFSKVRRSAGGDLNPEDLEDALDDPRITGDAIEHYSTIAPGRPAIVFAATLEHAAHVAEQFQAAGWRFEVIHGGLEDTERDRMIEGLATGALHGLVSKDLISEGTDIPVAEVAIFLRRTESEAFFLQACGRVLRPVYAPGHDLGSLDGRLAAIAASGKPYGIIIDHVGNVGRMVDGVFVAKHGRPHDDRLWDLRGRRRRRRAAEEEPAGASLRCPRCYVVDATTPRCTAIQPDGTECGYKFSDEELGLVAAARRRAPGTVEGKLVEVPEDAEAIARAELRRAQAQARTVEEIVAATGMATGRAAHIVTAREEKDRLRRQLRELCDRWYRQAGHADVSLQRAVRDAFGFGPADVWGMKPKALRAAVEAVTAEILRIELGETANDNAIVIRPADAAS